MAMMYSTTRPLMLLGTLKQLPPRLIKNHPVLGICMGSRFFLGFSLVEEGLQLATSQASSNSIQCWELHVKPHRSKLQVPPECRGVRFGCDLQLTLHNALRSLSRDRWIQSLEC